MINWWLQFVAKWDWTDPMLLLSLITAMVTALIPVFLWRLDSKQAKRQVQILKKQKQVFAKGRRDELLKVVYSDEAPRSLSGTFFILSYSSQNTEQKLIHFTFLSQQMMLSSRQDGPEREIPPLIPPRSSLPRLDMAFLSNHNEVREERRGRTSPNPVGLMEERIRT